ncbi:YitT family protein [Pseudalkalibacillus caeni]|uniref:YitT family protein n=1 Tax=Exobacillus caeni TaxID=2574798 RepID=A0A5R9F3S8_9BACL|nr:YitT family protein [Pseudalkalibacillus caeni]
MKREVNRYFFLLGGAVLQGLAMSLFLFPHGIPSGGAAGTAILLNHWFHLSLGFSLWLVNFLLLVLAINSFGYGWTMRTMFSVTITSYTVNVIGKTMYMPHVSLWIDLIVGGLVFGLGVGLLIRNGASSGGMVIPALVIASYRRCPPGKAMFWINLIIFILTASVVNMSVVVYAVLCQWLSTKVIDFVYRFQLKQPLALSVGWRKR